MEIYLSGKISGLSIKEYTDNFHNAEIDVCKLFKIIKNHYSNPIINPLNIKPFLGIKCWLCYMIADILKLKQCSHIAMQKNWIESRGAVIEYYFAKFIFKQKVIWL